MSENVDLRLLQRQVVELKAESDRLKKGSDTGNGNPPGGDNVEARVARLETHIEYIRRDLDEVMVDVKSIKSRLAYLAGAGFVLLAIFAWVANNRFDQVLDLLAK